MSSIKCAECGLVNFSTAVNCKRCQSPLGGFSAIAEQRAYQTSAEQTQSFNQNQKSFQTFQAPPPPPTFDNGEERQQPVAPMSCIKCSGRRGVCLQDFKKDYVPPIAYLGMFIGLLPMVILILILRVKHPITAPFCGECWSKFRKVGMVENLTSLCFFAAMIAAVFAMVLLGSGKIFFLFLVPAIVLIVWGQIYKTKNSPKYKKVDRKQVVIDDPVYGEVCFVK